MKTIAIISVLLIGCTSKVSEETKNHEALLLHNSMIKKANMIEHRLSDLKGDTTVNKDSVRLFATLLEQWKTDLVEVPGNEEHDHHGHGYDHGHSATPDVTAEQMLAIQKELDERLSTIGKRINRLKPEFTHDAHKH